MTDSRPAKGGLCLQPPGRTGPDADVLVLGAGVIGVTTAYALARRGYSVIVADRAEGPAKGSSFANGAQLSYVYTDALAQAGLLVKMPALLAGRDHAFRIHLSADPDFARWILAFLRNCTKARFSANTRATLELGRESQSAMADLRYRHSFEFGHATPGKLHIFREASGMECARKIAAIKRPFGVEQEFLSPSQALEIEPALQDTDPFEGALWTPGEEIGDPYRFCRELLSILRNEYGVDQRFGFDVTSLTNHEDRFSATSSTGETLTARRAVICLGAEAANFLRDMGIGVPILPMKGYSFTAPPGRHAPSVSITDTARKIVFCRLGDAIRVAGFADLDARDRSIEPARMQTLLDDAKAALPHAARYERAGAHWAGLRPMTPDSRPIIKQAAPGLFLNVGHGMLGWTFACGSAERLAALVESADNDTMTARKVR